MDFLNPKKKRLNKIQLTIGHILMVVLVFTATYILVFRAYGYDYDTKTGQVIQDGLVYIASAPDGAVIKINGRQRATTNTRMDLPEGRYSLEIDKTGYNSWKRNFDLQGGEVLRLDYPMLLPSNLETSELKTFKDVGFASQSPDRRWIIIERKDNLSSMTVFDLQNRQNKLPVSSGITFPSSLFKAVPGSHAIRLVEWSTDNRHLLVKHEYKGGHEFIMLDIQKPAESYNVNKTFNQTPDKANLFNKKFDQLFLYDAKRRVLFKAGINAKSPEAFARNVISYKSYGNDTLLYSRTDPKDNKKADIIMRQKNTDYTIKKIPISTDIPLDVTKYNGHWYVVIGVQSQKRTYVYRDPISLVLNQQTDIDSIRAIVLSNPGKIDEVSFSQNAQFIMSNSGQSFSVYNILLQQPYSYKIPEKFDKGLKPYWMDGNRIMASSGGKALVFDYDGVNKHTLLKTDPTEPVMFNRDYTEMYTLGDSTSAKGQAAIFLTYLKTPADR